MAVAKYNWHGTNPNRAFRTKNPPIGAWGEMVKLNATRAETEAAYNALKNGGKVSDFKTKVWNDICAKVYDLCDEWQINETYRKYSAWSPFIHDPDRKAWEALAKKNWPDWDEYQIEEWLDYIWGYWKPGHFYAWSYNVVYSQWLLPVGLTKFEVKSGQRLKGEYILRLVEIINHWTELSPMTVQFRAGFNWGKKGKVAVLSSLPLDPDYLDMTFTLQEKTQVDDSVQMHIRLDINGIMERFSIAELTSCPLSSLMNFMKMNVKCKIWDKFPIYMTVDLGMQHEGVAAPVMLSLVHIKALWEGIFDIAARGDIAYALDGFQILLDGILQDRVKPGMADAYGFSVFADYGQHRGTGKIRTRRPLPFAAYDAFSWMGRVLVEHQGTLLLFMEDGAVSFTDSSTLTKDASVQGEQSGEIPIKKVNADASVSHAVIMDSEEDTITYHGREIEGHRADAVGAEHRDRFKTRSSQTLLKPPGSPITAQAAGRCPLPMSRSWS